MSVVLRPGWELDNPNNSSVIFKAKVSQTLFGVSGRGSKQVEIVNNTSTGNFDFYRVNLIGQRESNPFISYNASNDIPEIKDLSIYSDFYDTTNGQNQFTTLIKSSKEATLNIAELNAGVDPVNLRNYNTIKGKSGYKSLANAVPAPPPPPKKDPPLAANPSADPSSGGGANPNASSGTDISGATLTSFSENEKANTLEGILRYPKKHTGDYDYLMIQPIEYVPGFGGGSPSGPTIERASKRISRQKTATGPRIYLPMTSGISESNSVGWGSDELNPINLAFGKAAFESINALATTNLAKGIQDAGNAMTTAVKSLITGNNNNTLQTAVASYFAGQAVGANFLGRSGIVLNPNLELLFQGPKLRSFRYNFRFTPRDADEAKEIRRIIKTFKKTMAVRQSPGSLFLGVPSIYELRYIYNSDETSDHPFLNKIKPCALTAFNVNYTPDGSYMTYQDGSMTSYTVDMQFDEIEPIYNEDIDDVDGPTMGY
jgi:hypothetical protein